MFEHKNRYLTATKMDDQDLFDPEDMKRRQEKDGTWGWKGLELVGSEVDLKDVNVNALHQRGLI